MSRSYKKSPVVKDHTKGAKKIANRRVRAKLKQNPDAIGQNGSYKKVYEQWNIHDWQSMQTEQEAITKYYSFLNSEQPWKKEYVKEYTLETWLQEWKKYYKRK